MRYIVAGVTSPLESVSQICDAGNIVVFTKHGGYINGPKQRIAFERQGDNYVRKTWVRSDRVKKKENTQAKVDKDGDAVMGLIARNPGGFARQGPRP